MENAASILNRLGVCSWSLQPASADGLFRKLDRVGIRNVQIALDPVRENAGGAVAERVAEAAGAVVVAQAAVAVSAPVSRPLKDVRCGLDW